MSGFASPSTREFGCGLVSFGICCMLGRIASTLVVCWVGFLYPVQPTVTRRCCVQASWGGFCPWQHGTIGLGSADLDSESTSLALFGSQLPR